MAKTWGAACEPIIIEGLLGPIDGLAAVDDVEEKPFAAFAEFAEFGGSVWYASLVGCDVCDVFVAVTSSKLVFLLDEEEDARSRRGAGIGGVLALL